MPRLPYEMLEDKEQDREGLDKHLSGMGLKKTPTQELLSALDANSLKARQGASETPLGSLLGINPMDEKEQEFYATNRDQDLEESMDRGMQAGLGFGGINNMAPKALSALKGMAYSGAPRVAAPVAQEVAAMARVTAPKALKGLLPEKATELAKLEAANNLKAATSVPQSQREMREITKLLNRKFSTFK